MASEQESSQPLTFWQQLASQVKLQETAVQSYGKACSGDCVFLPLPMLQRLAGARNSLSFCMRVLAGLKVNLGSPPFF